MEGQENPPSWRFTGSKSESGQTTNDPSTNASSADLVEEHSASIKWTASEYIAHEKNVMWYLMYAGVMALVAVVVYLISHDVFSTIFLVIICAGVGAYGARKPRMQEYEITNQGVRFAGKAYLFTEFRSFALVHDGAVPSVWLIPLKRIMPPLIMYFEPNDEGKIVDLIGDFLPHEQQDYDLIERFMRYIRF